MWPLQLGTLLRVGCLEDVRSGFSLSQAVLKVVAGQLRVNGCSGAKETRVQRQAPSDLAKKGAPSWEAAAEIEEAAPKDVPQVTWLCVVRTAIWSSGDLYLF